MLRSGRSICPITGEERQDTEREVWQIFNNQKAQATDDDRPSPVLFQLHYRREIVARKVEVVRRVHCFADVVGNLAADGLRRGLIFVAAIAHSEESEILHENVNRHARFAVAVRPRVESLFAFDEQRVAFFGVFGENLRLFAGRGDVIPVGFLHLLAASGFALVVDGD